MSATMKALRKTKVAKGLEMQKVPVPSIGALEVLGRGGRLCVWVEGTRAVRPGMKRAEPGVGFLWRRHPGHFDLVHGAKCPPQLFPCQII